jgi:hypothetical protein
LRLKKSNIKGITILVKCKKYSVTYPDGGHRVGDVFDMTKEQAKYYSDIGWVISLPDELQPKNKRGRKKITGFATDMSKSPLKGRYLEHTFK